tara:strand:+ start:383 stop:559 length:177 start_codon:yes stop_codon:yes gene_type:complete
MALDAENLLGQLQKQIADLVTEFESNTLVRIDQLEIDNRMRGVGACNAHNIIVNADIE